MKKVLILFALPAAVAATASGDCRYERTVSPQISDSAGIDRVHIEARAGSLEVVGSSGSTIEARGVACSSHEDILDRIGLSSKRSGSTLWIVVEVPERNGWWPRHREMRLDLEVSVPSDMAVSIDDGSGSIWVRDVGDLDIEDGSGSISVRSVRSVRIDDGSGDIEIEDVADLVQIEDGSGSIDIRNVRGSVDIIDDGSGGIEIVEIAGDVEIGDDGSGSIYVSDVGGDLTVGDHGSGGVRFDRINGRVRIEDD